MSEETGFTTMTGDKARGEAPEIGVGMLGYAFMGKAHTNAYKTIPYMIYPPPAIPKLVGICGLVEDEAQEAARRYGYANYYADWRKMLSNARLHHILLQHLFFDKLSKRLGESKALRNADKNFTANYLTIRKNRWPSRGLFLTLWTLAKSLRKRVIR